MTTSLRDIEWAAQEELREEDFREAVDAAKVRIKARRGRPWWVRLFPYRIVIVPIKDQPQ